jgi:hypothetical protein
MAGVSGGESAADFAMGRHFRGGCYEPSHRRRLRGERGGKRWTTIEITPYAPDGEEREGELMSRIGLSAIGFAGLALGLCGFAQAAGDVGDWERLQQLHPGDRVRVEVRGRPDVAGEFSAVTPVALQLVRNRKEQIDLERTEIGRVYRMRSRARAAAPWIGMAAGFGVGFARGWPGGSSAGCWFLCIPKPVTGTVVGAVGAGVGVLAGYVVAGRAEHLVYRAR